MDKKPLTRRLAVITGAASGIGFELAKQFAKDGFNLLITSRSPSVADAADCLRKYGHEVEYLQTDLASYAGTEKLYRKIRSLGWPLDTVVMNACFGPGGVAFDKTEFEEEMDVIRLNINSIVHLTKRILPDMLEQRFGRILFTSAVPTIAKPYHAVFSASVAFVETFADAIRQEVGDKGITVLHFQPSTNETNVVYSDNWDEYQVINEGQ